MNWKEADGIVTEAHRAGLIVAESVLLIAFNPRDGVGKIEMRNGGNSVAWWTGRIDALSKRLEAKKRSSTHDVA